MASDFVREVIALLERTPRTAWDSTVRMTFGGDRPYIARRDPERTERVRQLIQSGYSERTAQLRVKLRNLP